MSAQVVPDDLEQHTGHSEDHKTKHSANSQEKAEYSANSQEKAEYSANGQEKAAHSTNNEEKFQKEEGAVSLKGATQASPAPKARTH